MNLKLKFSSYLIVSLLIIGNYSCTQTNDKFKFPLENYIIETKTVHTSTGNIQVKYHTYLHISYVSNPVDKDYQSLNVFVPVEINGKSIDASNAPIFFKVGVGGYMPVNNAKDTALGNPDWNSREDLALAAGMVVVSPGCRGRSNQAQDGVYYGKAPAAIVDLKAAVRYIKYNKGVLPGNVDQIVSDGCSAGGDISALLGASGNSSLYDDYLKEIGAANTTDNIFASACYSPIADLEHADMAYEWMYGTIPVREALVDQELSGQLKENFKSYQASLKLKGKDSFGVLSADNYETYLLHYYLIPSANKHLSELPENDRLEYLNENRWMTWENNEVSFTFEDYVVHVGRMKGLPAFDDFDMRSPETHLFGNDSVNARHFTDFSLKYTSGDPEARISDELKSKVNLMNPMFFILQDNPGCVNNWWLRNGTSDFHTSQTVMVNLATALENNDKLVNTWLFWDGGHCADDDPEGLINWIKTICNYE